MQNERDRVESSPSDTGNVFLQQFRAISQNPHFVDTCAAVYDRFDNFSVVMVYTIGVRSSDKNLLYIQMMK